MLADMLHVDRVSLAMDARTKDAALRQLAGLFKRGDLEVDEALAFRVFAEREALASTGVGSGVAIPHGRLSDLPGVRLALGLHPAGVDFDAVDGRPVHIFVAVLAPNGEANKHLKVLARLSRLLRDASIRERLLGAATSEAARELLVGEDTRLG
jgi:PTS system nitrogen regulatory IIA component